MGRRRLVVGQHLLQRIREHCLDEKPYEACGILTGKGDQVLHAYATDNVRQSPVFYQVSPEHQEEVLRAMEARGEELLAIYHSHPTTEAKPSQNDIRMAVHYPEAVRLIISLAGRIDLRGYLIDHGRAYEVEILPAPDTQGEWHDLRGKTAGL